ncbi:MAG: LytTR family DNA-binding domain-containing protein [Pseudomonadota bacterium]
MKSITLCNGTVLGVASLSRTLPIVAVVLIALFVFVKPESTSGFTTFQRFLFWTLQIGLGLVGLVVVSHVWARLHSFKMGVVGFFVTGLAGAALLAPVYLIVEAYMPAVTEMPDDWLDHFANRGTFQAVIAEFIEVTPVFLSAWLAINLPLFLQKPIIGGNAKPPSPTVPPGGSPAVIATNDAEEFFSLLPEALGRDIVALSADLHYLHVHTTQGKCMVLYSLKRAADVLGDTGILIHRSHWASFAHIRRLNRKGQLLLCEMSNGLQLPVSRRKKKEVTSRFGDASKVVVMDKVRRRA